MAAFAIITGVVSLVGTAYSIIDSLANHGTGGDFGPVLKEFLSPGDATKEKLDALSEQVEQGFMDVQERLDTLQSELSDLITGQIGEVRQQALMGALARSQSAQDLVSSLDAGIDVEPGQIIAEASLGLRDVLAQAKTIATPTATYTPSVGDISVAAAAVGVALAVRTQVAIALESDQIGSTALNNQLLAAANFFRNAVDDYRAALALDKEFRPGFDFGQRVYFLGQLNIPNSAEFDFFDPESGASGNTFETKLPYSEVGSEVYLTFITADYPLQEISALLVADSESPYFIGQARFDELVTVNQFGNWTINVTDPNGGGRALAYVIAEYRLENFALGQLGAGAAGAVFLRIAEDFSDLANGDELVLPSRAGQDNSGMLIGDLDGPGKDLLVGNDGDDVLNGLADNDIVRGEEGDDTLLGGDGQDRLEGGLGNDVLRGEGDDDELFGAEGDDILDGGAGFDKAGFRGDRADYVVTREGGLVFVEGPDGRDTLADIERLFFADATLTLVYSDVEGSQLSGTDGDDMIAHDGANGVIVGGAGDDILTVTADPASLGDVAVFSGSRADYAISFGDPETLVVSGPDGTDSLGAGFDLLRFDDAEIAILYSPNFGGDNVFGTTDEDILYDESGSYTLFGSPGDDLIVAHPLVADPFAAQINGGDGVDTVRLFGDLADHQIRLLSGAGGEVQSVRNGDGARLVLEVERLVFDDATVGIVTGTDAGETLHPSGSPEVLAGLGGDDVIDARYYTQVTSAGATAPIANFAPMVLSGGGGNDQLFGGFGNDVLDGGLGNDLLYGAGGLDTAVLTGSAEQYYFGLYAGIVLVGGKAGTPAAPQGIKALWGIERLEFQTVDAEATAAFNLHAATDDLEGTSDTDLILIDDGSRSVGAGAAADTVVGGAGDDTLDGADGDDLLMGKQGLDSISGGAGDDSIDGGLGNDMLDGGDGADMIAGGGGGDVIEGGEGNDWLSGEEGDDVLTGGAGEDSLAGGAGDDEISGGAGDDWMMGEDGADGFVFQLQGSRQVDRIMDFDPVSDRILVETMFFNTVVSGNDTVLDFGGGELLIIQDFTDTTALADSVGLYY